MTEPHATARPTLAFAALLAAVLAALGAGSASAQVISATATSSPEFAVFPTTRSAEFRLQLVTGATPVPPLSVGFLIPDVGDAGAGWTLGIGDLRLEGPGQVNKRPGVHIDPFGNVCFRGFSSRDEGAILRLPANSTTTLVVPATLSSAPPLEDTSYRLGFDVEGVGTRIAPGPLVSGPLGVRIGIHLRRRDGVVPNVASRWGRLREPIRVSGGTDPRLRNRTLTLRFVRDFPSGRTVSRRVQTDEFGRYSYRWKPGRTGEFRVTALFKPAAGDQYAADAACPSQLRVVAPGVVAPR